MIPLEDAPEERRRSFPVVTLLLIVANLAVFAYELSLGPGLPEFVRSFGLVPAALLGGYGQPAGTSSPPALLTLFTSMFLHGGFLHVGGNMLFLWIFGDNVEDTLGHLGFLGFYLFCGVIATLAQVASSPYSQTPIIGASGAIAGVLGAYLLLFPNATVRTLLLIGPFVTVTRVSAFLMIAVWILFQTISGFANLGLSAGAGSDVAFFAHLGGFAAGLALITAWRAIRRGPPASAGA